MQKMYPRTNPAPLGASEASENSNVIAASQIEEALRESVRQNAAHIRHEPENTSHVVTDVNSLVQRVAGVALD
jgi:type II secretory pathway component GspD/PulD (secretin)